MTIAAGGLSVMGGGATLISSGTNTILTTGMSSPALVVEAPVISGYNSSILHVKTAMMGGPGFFLLRVSIFAISLTLRVY